MVKRRPLRSANNNRARRPRRPGVYGPDKIEAAKIALRYELNDYELGKGFGIRTKTLYQSEHDHQEFSEALSLGKEAVDELVERSLYQLAVGYNVNAEKIFYNSRSRSFERVPYIKHLPPNVRAALFWMANRDPQNWRENHHPNVTSDDRPAAIKVSVETDQGV